MARNRFPVVPLFWNQPEEHVRKAFQAINGLLNGQGNNVEDVTLVPGATQTDIDVNYATPDTVALVQPRSASAAAATGLWTRSTKGKVTLFHDSNPATDRLFGVVLFG